MLKKHKAIETHLIVLNFSFKKMYANTAVIIGQTMYAKAPACTLTWLITYINENQLAVTINEEYKMRSNNLFRSFLSKDSKKSTSFLNTFFLMTKEMMMVIIKEHNILNTNICIDG